MNPIITNELDELCCQATTNCQNRGIEIIENGEEASKLVLLWLAYLRSTHVTGIADCLIDGTASAAREGIACVTLGLVRPALNSLRLQIDLALAWLYFKDHLIEWQRVQQTGEGFKLKTELIKYLSESFVCYSCRFALLSNCKTRSIVEPYRLLSAHIHGQGKSVLPQVRVPKDIIATPTAQNEFVELQKECSEYINDIFWSVFADSWASIPTELSTLLNSRFKTAEQKHAFYEPAHKGL